MTLLHLLSQLAAGLYMALTLLGAMLLVSQAPPLPRPADAAARAWRAYKLAWRLIALAVVVFCPLRAAHLFHARWLSEPMKLAGDIVTTTSACWAFILVLSARARLNGAEEPHVRRGVWLNLAIIGAMCLAAFA